MRRLIGTIDAVSRAAGGLAAVLVVLLVVLMLYDVVMRYVFNAPTLWGFDISTYLMGAAFLLSIAYALLHDSHVRVDLLYTPATRHRLRIVDLIGLPLIVLPICAWITWGLWGFFLEAVHSGERSGTSAWNPLVWPFRLITFAGFLIFTLQVAAEAVKRFLAVAASAQASAQDDRNPV